MRRILGRSSNEFSVLKTGFWTVSGPWTFNEEASGWGQIDGEESSGAVHLARDMGLNHFDTAQNTSANSSNAFLARGSRVIRIGLWSPRSLADRRMQK